MAEEGISKGLGFSMGKWLVIGLLILTIFTIVGSYFFPDLVETVQESLIWFIIFAVVVTMMGSITLHGTVQQYTKFMGKESAQQIAKMIILLYLILGFVWIALGDDPRGSCIIMIVLFVIMTIFVSKKGRKTLLNSITKGTKHEQESGEYVVHINDAVKRFYDDKSENKYDEDKSWYEHLKTKGVTYTIEEEDFDAFKKAWPDVKKGYDAADGNDVQAQIDRFSLWGGIAKAYGEDFTEDTSKRNAQSEFDDYEKRKGMLSAMTQIMLICKYQDRIMSKKSSTWADVRNNEAKSIGDVSAQKEFPSFARKVYSDLGVPEDQITDYIQNGKSLEGIADAYGKRVDDLKTFAHKRAVSKGKSSEEARELINATQSVCKAMGWRFSDFVEG